MKLIYHGGYTAIPVDVLIQSRKLNKIKCDMKSNLDTVAVTIKNRKSPYVCIYAYVHICTTVLYSCITIYTHGLDDQLELLSYTEPSGVGDLYYLESRWRNSNAIGLSLALTKPPFGSPATYFHHSIYNIFGNY